MDNASAYDTAEMARFCQQRNLAQVTFPVRASLVRDSWPQLQALLGANPNFSLTVWRAKTQSENATLDADAAWMWRNLPAERTFYDLD